ncbi:MAG: 50S ribosomal protein L22 [Anaerolineae bacterium]
MATEGYQAVQKYVGISAQKVRLVINQVRGMSALAAIDALQFMPQAAAEPVSKAIKSALANAENNFGANPDGLTVAAITADGGPMRRWRRFGARGRFKPIQRRSSHITVVLTESAE